MQRSLGTAAFEWEASHSKRALAFPHERLHQEGKRGKQAPHDSENCYS
jgi:hypothetical protein